MEDATASEQVESEEPSEAAENTDNSVESASEESQVQAAELENLESNEPASGSDLRPSLDIVLDVPVTLSLEVGRAEMSVGELLKLGQGAVVELDRAVGEPLDVMVNGALVAHGEIVLVNEKFGIRLTSVVESSQRKQKEAS